MAEPGDLHGSLLHGQASNVTSGPNVSMTITKQ
jgi:hypothetical protein